MDIEVWNSEDKYIESRRNEELKNAVLPALGFWLLPLEALAQINADGRLVNEQPRPRGGKTRNLKEHWPELALLSLP